MTEHEMNYAIAAMETFFEYELRLNISPSYSAETPVEECFELFKTILDCLGYELEIWPDGNISIGKVTLH
jgi:hypothetical protein